VTISRHTMWTGVWNQTNSREHSSRVARVSNSPRSRILSNRWPPIRSNGKRILPPLPVIPRYPKKRILDFQLASLSKSMSLPRGPIEPGRASQTPEIGSPADRAGGNDASRESRVPRGPSETDAPAMAGLLEDGSAIDRKIGGRVAGKRFQQ
jgi:hypothetical protein